MAFWLIVIVIANYIQMKVIYFYAQRPDPDQIMFNS